MIHALVCDDYEPISNLVSVVLQGMGMEVTAAGDGQKALDLARSLRPDLIISDIDMPGLTGIDLFRSLQKDTTGLALTPFILMSSIDRRKAAQEAGCGDFLAKPFSIDEVRHMVHKALSRRGDPPKPGPK